MDALHASGMNITALSGLLATVQGNFVAVLTGVHSTPGWDINECSPIAEGLADLRYAFLGDLLGAFASADFR